MPPNIRLWSRKLHRWGAAAIALPLAVVICTGILLLLKKQVDWIQPPARRGQGQAPRIAFAAILDAAKRVPDAGIGGWEDIDRLDVRPSKGIVKVRAKNHWEVQMDFQTGEVLQTAYRRSDIVESIHDGTWFHARARLWVFLPSALILLGLWVTGVYLFFLPHWVKSRRARPSREAGNKTN